jgi:tRNA pseudouridine55 synthase
MNKIVNILKPTGMTSHDVVSRVRKILNIKKVGHTGTLDPDASGVLPICIGKATKVSELILNKDKGYICELTLGITTDTYDSSGEILEKCEDFNVSLDELEKAFDSQRGEIKQLPPMYSALKINGKRMCDLVRSGRSDEIELKYRDVNIKKLEILSYKDNKVMFYVKCSKGTYVRSICYDVGKELGCGGHMSFLLRTSSGKFDLENGITLEELKEWHKRSGLPLKKFFNTSGLLYKDMGLKDKLPKMSEEEQLRLLATDGMLVKRPLVIGEDYVLTGFREKEWEEKILQ